MLSKCARPPDTQDAKKREGILVTVLGVDGVEYKARMRRKVRVEQPPSTTRAPDVASRNEAAVAAEKGAGDAAHDPAQQPAALAAEENERWADRVDEATTVVGDGDAEEEEPDLVIV